MLALRKKWLPHDGDTPEALGQAMWLEESYWDRQYNATTRAITKALTGK